MNDDPIAESILNGTYNHMKWTKKDSLFLGIKIVGLLISAKYLYRDWNTDVSMWYVLVEIIAVILFFGMLLMSCGIVDVRVQMNEEKK